MQNGSLAVQGGRDIVPTINEFLSLPFALRIATKDWHPQDHISFASNHPPPDNKPFETIITIHNPLNPEETQETRLWPDHCVQGSSGAELLPELQQSEIKYIVEKGQDKRVEMYSAFRDPFLNPTVSRSTLAEKLRSANITDVYVVGLAADYCVRYTALHSVQEGFETWVVPEATRPVDPASLPEVYQEYETAGIKLVTKDEVKERVTS